MEPSDFVPLRVRLNVALKVDIVPFFYVIRVQGAAEVKRHLRWILNRIFSQIRDASCSGNSQETKRISFHA